MLEPDLITAVKEHDIEGLTAALADGANPNQQDERGWTPLSWAAGKGSLDTVQILLERGADVTCVGMDNRTPLMIAKAAGNRSVAAALAAAEKARFPSQESETRPYCKAYFLDALQRYPKFVDARAEGDRTAVRADGESRQEIVYLHQDMRVTQSVWHNENVVFDDVTPEWVDFCRTELNFAIPEDLC